MSALIDTSDIAEILGVRRDYVTDRLTKRPDFPPPAVNLSRRLRRWRLMDVMRWAEESGKSGPKNGAIAS